MTTVASAFETLKTNIEITGLQRSTVSTRQQSVREIVENGMTVLNSFLTGSYSRSTVIVPLSEADIDIFTVLNSTYYHQYTPAALLDRLRTILMRTYTKTPKISKNGQAVTITFTDFIVDVVPAFNRQGGGYLIPSSPDNKWISTNPKYHVDYIAGQNTFHRRMLVPTLKMIKRWNKQLNNAFVSFYLELMAAEIFSSSPIQTYESAMVFFFLKGKEKIKYKMSDPVIYGGQIDGLRGVSTVSDAVSRQSEITSQIA